MEKNVYLDLLFVVLLRKSEILIEIRFPPFPEYECRNGGNFCIGNEGFL